MTREKRMAEIKRELKHLRAVTRYSEYTITELTERIENLKAKNVQRKDLIEALEAEWEGLE